MLSGPVINLNKKAPAPLVGPEPFLCRHAPGRQDYLQFLLLVLSVALVVRLVLRCWVPLVLFFWVVLVLRLVVLFV